jgi:hypothetical protein
MSNEGRPPRRRFVSGFILVLGLTSLGYVLGAAVMFFGLPSADFLGKAFQGGRAWEERRQATEGALEHSPIRGTRGTIDRPGETFDGFTLCTFAALDAWNTQAFLINMRGDIVHRWALRFSQVWSRPPHLAGRVHDALVCFFGCHLYPNGDLLVVFHGLEGDANGYGLAKIDKKSNVLWAYPARVHHDVDVGEDGTIYAIKYEINREAPKGLETLPTPWLEDKLVVLSPDGKELRRPIPILPALLESPYAPLLSSLRNPDKGASAGQGPADVLHMNFVQVLRRDLAPKFPSFKAGQILFSARDIDTIGVLDPKTGAVVWAAQGPWRHQHDAQFLENGRLMLFDNLGSPAGSRVLEYDPRTQALPWSYPGRVGTPFLSRERGMSQRLPNGNTLIVNSEGKQLLEVTGDRRVVWSRSFGAFICSGRRYSREQLPFLKGDIRARP